MDFPNSSSMDDLMSSALPPEEQQTQADLKPKAKAAPKKPKAPAKPAPKSATTSTAQVPPPAPPAQDGMSTGMIVALVALAVGGIYYFTRK
jgi:hypothetical protein